MRTEWPTDKAGGGSRNQPDGSGLGVPSGAHRQAGGSGEVTGTVVGARGDCWGVREQVGPVQGFRDEGNASGFGAPTWRVRT